MRFVLSLVVGLIFFVSATVRAQLDPLLMQAERELAQVSAIHRTIPGLLTEAAERFLDFPSSMQGRLTVSSTEPVPTTNQAAPGTIYFLPYRGARVALYDGSTWRYYSMSSTPSYALAGRTAGTNYDVFLYNNAGTPAIESPPTAWTNDTTRATALTTQNGILVKSGDATRRYIGTFRATAATTTVDTSSQRFVWSYYNREPRFMVRLETTNNWTGTNAISAMNGSAANIVEFVVGVNEVLLTGRVLAAHIGTNATARTVASSLCIDNNNATDLDIYGSRSLNVARVQTQATGYEYPAAAGYHYWQWVEVSNTNCQFYGDDAGDGRLQSGFYAWVEG